MRCLLLKVRLLLAPSLLLKVKPPPVRCLPRKARLLRAPRLQPRDKLAQPVACNRPLRARLVSHLAKRVLVRRELPLRRTVRAFTLDR